MPRAHRVIESAGSFWFFDDDQMMFCRVPKTEGPRQSPPGKDWGGPKAGILQDLVWQPFVRDTTDGRRLYIVVDEEDGHHISAPLI